MRTAHVRRLAIATVLLAGCAAVAGCSTTSDATDNSVAASTSGERSTSSAGSAPISTGSAVTRSTTRWDADQEAVIEDYLAAREAFSTSLESPDPDDASLPATHVDPMLTEVRDLNAKWKGFGQAGRFPDPSVARIEPLQVEIDGDTATIETCGIDDSIVYDVATGRVLDDSVVTVRSTSTLNLVAGTWKLATRSELERWEGVAGCALELP